MDFQTKEDFLKLNKLVLINYVKIFDSLKNLITDMFNTSFRNFIKIISTTFFYLLSNLEKISQNKIFITIYILFILFFIILIKYEYIQYKICIT